MLENTDVLPSGMHTQEILIVRALTDPLPGGLTCSPYALRPDERWTRAVQSRLGDLHRRAAHPAKAAVPGNADAVVFSDQSEMLACLSKDWISGELVNRWWWSAIVRGMESRQAVLREWLESPGSMPKALEQLSASGDARRFVMTLGENDVRRLVMALVVNFGLHMLKPVIDDEVHHRRQSDGSPTIYRDRMREMKTGMPLISSSTQEVVTGIQGTGSMDEDGESVSEVSGQWQLHVGGLAEQMSPAVSSPGWIPETDYRGLDFIRKFFLALGLLLHRAPSVIHSHRFAHELIEWLDREESSCHRTTAGIPRSAAGAEGQTRLSLGNGRRVMGPERSLPDMNGLPLQDGFAEPNVRGGKDSQSVISDLVTESPVPIGGVHCSAREVVSNRFRESSVESESPSEICEKRVETGLGGLFYLINVAIHLELYPDFTRPLDSGLPMPIWDFIELIGRRMLRGKFEHDPVWLFLHRLAGRKMGERPGEYFVPTDEWRIPAEWLKPFTGHSAWMWSVDSRRLRVHHHEGFCILDVKWERDPRQTLRKEIGRYSGVADLALRRSKRRQVEMRSTERWLGWVVPYILARLRLALGVRCNRDAVRLMLNHHAEIEEGDARLDVRFSLADHPIEIRTAGLDRDPGWVPAGGRLVSFHYI